MLVCACGGAPRTPRSPAVAITGNLSFRRSRFQKSPQDQEVPTRRFENPDENNEQSVGIGIGCPPDAPTVRYKRPSMPASKRHAAVDAAAIAFDF